MNLYNIGYLTSTPSYIPNTSRTFWSCFAQALTDNEKYLNGKQRVLSIVANEFSYAELQDKLGVNIFFNISIEFYIDSNFLL